MKVEYPDHPFYYQVGNMPVGFIKQETLQEKKLETVFDVVVYLKEVPEIKSQMAYQRESVFEGQIRSIGDKIASFKTSEANPFRLYLKYIEESSLISSKVFFEERNIEFGMIVFQKGLRNCIESIIVSDYTPDLTFVWHANKVSSKSNAASKGNVIFTIITLAIDPDKDEPIIIDDDYVIIPDSSHTVVADHVFINTSTNAVPLLITEDKGQGIMNEILRNFDQLRSFSMTPKGAEMRIFSGLVTDLQNWVFTCYVRPEGTKAVSFNNFYVSQILNLNHKEVGSLDEDNVMKLIRIIRGYISREIQEVNNIIATE